MLEINGVNQLSNIITVLSQPKRTSAQIKKLEELTWDVPFFKEYRENGKDDVHRRCCSLMSHESFENGQAIFHVDTTGDKFYIILEGTVGVYIWLPGNMQEQSEKYSSSSPPPLELVCVKELQQGLSFGELALLQNKKRMASIICHSVCHVATLDKQSFHQVLGESEEQKLLNEMQFFAELPFFEGWNSNLLKLLYLNSYQKSYTKGQIIFKEGSDSNAVYFVKSGEFELSKIFSNKPKKDSDDSIPQNIRSTSSSSVLSSSSSTSNRTIKLAIYGAKEFFGEEDIFEQRRRSFTIKCISFEGEVIVIKAKDFHTRMLCEQRTKQYTNQRYEMKKKIMEAKILQIRQQLHNFSDFFFFGDHSTGSDINGVQENPLLYKQTNQRAQRKFSTSGFSGQTSNKVSQEVLEAHLRKLDDKSMKNKDFDLSAPPSESLSPIPRFKKQQHSSLFPIRSSSNLRLIQQPSLTQTSNKSSVSIYSKASLIIKTPEGADSPTLFNQSIKRIQSLPESRTGMNSSAFSHFFPLQFIEEEDNKCNQDKTPKSVKVNQTVKTTNVKTVIPNEIRISQIQKPSIESQIFEKTNSNENFGEDKQDSDNQLGKKQNTNNSFEKIPFRKPTKLLLPNQFGDFLKQSQVSQQAPVDNMEVSLFRQMKDSMDENPSSITSNHQNQQQLSVQQQSPQYYKNEMTESFYRNLRVNYQVKFKSSSVQNLKKHITGSLIEDMPENFSEPVDMYFNRSSFRKLSQSRNKKDLCRNAITETSQYTTSVFSTPPQRTETERVISSVKKSQNEYNSTYTTQSSSLFRLSSQENRIDPRQSKFFNTNRTGKDHISVGNFVNLNDQVSKRQNSIFRLSKSLVTIKIKPQDIIPSEFSQSNSQIQQKLTAQVIYQRHQQGVITKSQSSESLREKLLFKIFNAQQVNNDFAEEEQKSENQLEKSIKNNFIQTQSLRLIMSPLSQQSKGNTFFKDSPKNQLSSSQSNSVFRNQKTNKSQSLLTAKTLSPQISRSYLDSPSSGNSQYSIFKPMQSRKVLSGFEKSLNKKHLEIQISQKEKEDFQIHTIEVDSSVSIKSPMADYRNNIFDFESNSQNIN